MIDDIAQSAVLRTGLSLKALIMVLLAQLAVSNFLLLGFLGAPLWLFAPIALVALGSLLIVLNQSAWPDNLPTISWRNLLICAVLACGLLILGGEGRLLYANFDWQVRDTVLADMVRNDWPYQYRFEQQDYILRAPLGMYLLPAALAKLGMQQAQHWLLLVCNTALLTLLLAIGQNLFSSTKARWTAFAFITCFSGLDIIGTSLFYSLGVDVSFDHIEWWSRSSQYSSVITLLFWVPNHAFAGWTCAILFMLHQKRMLPLGALAAAMPMVGIWSPLALMGAFPFAVLAGVQALASRSIKAHDIALSSVGLLIAVPSLLYLRLDPSSIASSFGPKSLALYVFGISLEVAPFAWLVSKFRGQQAEEKWAAWLAIACLVAFPFYQIGTNSDFQMRATIMPMMIIALRLTDFVSRAGQLDQKRLATFAWVVVAIGGVTGALEVRRAFTYTPSPAPLCKLTGVWYQQDIDAAALGTYLARRSELPTLIAGNPKLSTDNLVNPKSCWSRPWQTHR